MDRLETLVDLLQHFDERGKQPAIIAARGAEFQVTRYADIARGARAIACFLRESGAKQEEPIGILSPNSPEWIIAYFAIVAAGATAMPLDHHAPAKDIELMLERSGCRRLFTVSAHVPDMPAGWRDRAAGIYLMDDSDPPPGSTPWRKLLDAPAGTALPAIESGSRASLLFTSGTTGNPKAVPLTHGHFLSNVKALLKERIVSENDRLLLPLPLHHAYPFTVGMLSVLASGAALVLPSGITGPLILEAAKSTEATVILGVPGLHGALLKAIKSRVARTPWFVRHPLRWLLGLSTGLRRRFGIGIGHVLFSRLHREFGGKLRVLASGGAKLEPVIAWELEGLGWQVLTGYGLTETAPILTFNPPGRARLDSEGLPIPGVAIRIEKRANEPFGEVLASGASVFTGYLDDRQANAAAFTQDNWFRTGDLGYLDDAGYLHIVGRANETLVLPGGKKIFPEDVEKQYLGIPFIKEMAILLRDGALVGLVVPDPEAVRQRGAARVEGLVREEVERVSGRLRPHERLGQCVITTETLPRTQLGKLKRHKLGAIFDRAKAGRSPPPQRALSAADLALVSAADTKPVWDWLTARYPDIPLSPDMSPQLDLGVDSLQWIELTLELQDRFGVRLTEAAVGRILSLRDLLNEVAAARTEEASGAGDAPGTALLPPPAGLGHALLGRFLLGLCKLLVRIYFRLEIRGRDRVPMDRAVVLAPNHASYLDPLVVAAAFNWRELQGTFWVGWSKIMLWGPVMRAVSRAFRVIPIDPDRDPRESLDLAGAALRSGGRVVWFPEGRLSATGDINAFLPGVAHLMEKTGAMAVPVNISGTFEALPRTRFFPRPAKIVVTFGQAMKAEELTPAGEGENRWVRIAAGLRGAVVALSADRDRES